MRRFAFLSILVSTGACGVEKIEDTSTTCVPAPVQAVFDARCATTPACHGSGSPNVSLAAGESAAIIGGMGKQAPSLPLVELGSVDRSYLAHKIMANPPMPIQLSRMPSGTDFNDPAIQSDMALIIGWIEGADLGTCGSVSDSSGSDTSASTTVTTTMTTDATDESSSTGEPVPALCGTEDLKPGAPNPIVSGDVAGQIPTEIGTILAENCGCHYADAPFSRDALSDYTGMVELATLEQWLAPYNDGAVTVIRVAQNYVENAGPGGMPPVFGQCDIGDGSGLSMLPDERATLLSWIEADGPDGANWPP